MNRENYLPLENAKNIIATALSQFDSDLGNRGAEILFNDQKLNIVEVAEAKTNMMQCRPAGITIEDVKAADMYIPDFSKKFGPHFTRQDNPAAYAIIDFEYDGSPRSVIWLAHELGHAIADDVQRENGHSFKNFSAGEMEEQAYFVQHIVSRYLKDNLNQLGFRETDLEEDTLKMSWERADQFKNAGEVFKDALTKEPGARREIVLNALDQRVPVLI